MRKFLLTGFIVILGLCAFSVPAYADNYGSGLYGAGAYSAGTAIETPVVSFGGTSGSNRRATTTEATLISQLQAQIVVLQTQLNALLAAQNLITNPVSTTTSPFTRDLYLYREGPDVKQLQVFLNTHGYPLSAQGAGAPGAETEMFGRLTLEALARFQAANQITPAVGYFGPKTRALVNELLK